MNQSMETMKKWMFILFNQVESFLTHADDNDVNDI